LPIEPYDSDPLRQRLKKRGIALIVPYRDNNKLRRYQDGRKLRRYKRRWIVERTNAWLGQFRRLLVRHETLLSIYRAFFYIACFWITLRRYFETRSSHTCVSSPFYFILIFMRLALPASLNTLRNFNGLFYSVVLNDELTNRKYLVVREV
jgi:hypothetical protein